MAAAALCWRCCNSAYQLPTNDISQLCALNHIRHVARTPCRAALPTDALPPSRATPVGDVFLRFHYRLRAVTGFGHPPPASAYPSGSRDTGAGCVHAHCRTPRAATHSARPVPFFPDTMTAYDSMGCGYTRSTMWPLSLALPRAGLPRHFRQTAAGSRAAPALVRLGACHFRPRHLLTNWFLLDRTAGRVPSYMPMPSCCGLLPCHASWDTRLPLCQYHTFLFSRQTTTPFFLVMLGSDSRTFAPFAGSFAGSAACSTLTAHYTPLPKHLGHQRAPPAHSGAACLCTTPHTTTAPHAPPHAAVSRGCAHTHTHRCRTTATRTCYPRTRHAFTCPCYILPHRFTCSFLLHAYALRRVLRSTCMFAFLLLPSCGFCLEPTARVRRPAGLGVICEHLPIPTRYAPANCCLAVEQPCILSNITSMVLVLPSVTYHRRHFAHLPALNTADLTIHHSMTRRAH